MGWRALTAWYSYPFLDVPAGDCRLLATNTPDVEAKGIAGLCAGFATEYSDQDASPQNDCSTASPRRDDPGCAAGLAKVEKDVQTIEARAEAFRLRVGGRCLTYFIGIAAEESTEVEAIARVVGDFRSGDTAALDRDITAYGDAAGRVQLSALGFAEHHGTHVVLPASAASCNPSS